MGKKIKIRPKSFRYDVSRASSVTVGQLKRFLKGLPDDMEIIGCCGGQAVVEELAVTRLTDKDQLYINLVPYDKDEREEIIKERGPVHKEDKYVLLITLDH